MFTRCAPGLSAGSWDYTIRVWDTRDGTCLDTVYDHGADVYGKTSSSPRRKTPCTTHTVSSISLKPHTILCVCVCVGLTCHHSRPFTMASCSRDSTVRLWSLTPLISPLLLNIITDQPWEKIIGNTGWSRSDVLCVMAPSSALNH